LEGMVKTKNGIEGLVGKDQYDLRGEWSKRLLRMLELLKWRICKLNSSIPVNNTKWVLGSV
jgi:hypothetical protein